MTSRAKLAISNIRDVANDMQVNGLKNAKSIVFIVETCNILLRDEPEEHEDQAESSD